MNPYLKSSIAEGRHSYLRHNRLMVSKKLPFDSNGQEYTYDYDNAQPGLARK